MKLNKKGQGQRNRKAKEGLAEGLVMLVWGILKWTIFLPITLVLLIFKKK
jgi:hypothetical protein|tara:strand:- start:847 stop:996 length:150 start_codon:yes stop_codon:yes gene_type:complete